MPQVTTRTLSAVGVDRTFNVTFIEGASVMSSNSLRWDFDPPSITLTVPNVMLVNDAVGTS